MQTLQPQNMPKISATTNINIKNNLTRKGRAKASKIHCVGIPNLVRRIQGEKATEVVPVKVQLSLKKAIPQPRSTWIRNLIKNELTGKT